MKMKIICCKRKKKVVLAQIMIREALATIVTVVTRQRYAEKKWCGMVKDGMEEYHQ